MDRSIMKDLIKWKDKKKHKPLMLLGVRQCGKTYIVKQFGKEQFENVAYFNFEENEAEKINLQGTMDDENRFLSLIPVEDTVSFSQIKQK